MSNESFKGQHGRGCVVQERSALLASDFGLNLLYKKAGKEQAEEILAECGVYSKGKNVGKPRGSIMWLKVLEGGMDYSIHKRGVLKPGCHDFRATAKYGIEHAKAEYTLDGYTKADRAANDVADRVNEINAQIAQHQEELDRSVSVIYGWLYGRKSGADESERDFEIDLSADIVEIMNTKIENLVAMKQNITQEA